MPYVGNPLADAYSARVKQDLTGGSGTSFTLSHAVSSPNDLSIYINHVRQEPTTAYTVNGTALTMTGSVAGTDDFYIIYDELALQSISHPTNQALTATAGTFTSGLVGTTGTFSGALSGTTGTFSGAVSGTTGTFSGAITANSTLDMNGTELILDADADTSITADTDDKIHFKIGGSDKATLDGSGSVSTIFHIGSSTPHSFHNSYNESYLAVGKTLMMQSTDNSGVNTAEIGANWHNNGSRVRNTGDGKYVYRQDIDTYNGWMTFMNGTNNSASAGTAVTWHDALALNLNSGQMIAQTDLNSVAQYFRNTNSSAPYGMYIDFSAAAPNNTDNYFLAAEDSSANRIKIYSAGTIKNSTGTYTSFSDERLKSDIVDAKSQWEDIKALKFKNFIKFDNPDFKQLGLIAQDVEKTSPNLVFDSPPDKGEIKHSSVFGTLYKDGDEIPEGKKIGDVKEVKSQVKNVKDSILYMKAVKALQEAMTRIETLEAKVKGLEEA